MNLKDTKYDAFISYRHTEPDKYVAETLHRELENFRLPSNVIKTAAVSKTRINRVFRDRDELLLTNNLAASIEQALANSDYLIVICSPRLPQSQWCMREIDTFIKLHGRDRIFTVLVEGEPEESFPPQLVNETVQTINENGETITYNQKYEPLAADVRGHNRKEMKRKLKDEVLRLLAPMFSLNYDDLKQRHREQKNRRILFATFVTCGVFLAFGITSTILALQINAQSKQIVAQNTEISAQAKELELQYTTTQKDYAKSMADVSANLLAEGDRLAALYVARSVLPTQLEHPEIPYVAEAQCALTDALFIYHDNRQVLPQYAIEVPMGIQSMQLSDLGTKLLVLDSIGQLLVWDTSSRDLIFQSQTGSVNYDEFQCIGEDKLLYNTNNGLVLYDMNSGMKQLLFDDSAKTILSPTNDEFFFLRDQNLMFMNLNDDTKNFTIDVSDYDAFSSFQGCFSDDGTYALAVLQKDDFYEALLISVKSQEILSVMPISEVSPSVYYGNHSFLVSYVTYDDYVSSCSTLYCLNENDLSVRWDAELPNDIISDAIPCNYDAQNNWCVYGNGCLLTLDAQNGTVLHRVNAEASILKGFLNNERSVLQTFTREGHYLKYQINEGELYDLSDSTLTLKSGVSDYCFSNGVLFLLPSGSNKICRYYSTEDGQRQILAQSDTSYFFQTLNQDATRILYTKNDTIFLSDINHNVIAEITSEDSIIQYAFIGAGNEKFAVFSDNVQIYSAIDGQLILEYPMPIEFSYINAISPNGKYFILESPTEENSIFAYSLESGQMLNHTPKAEFQTDGCSCVFAENSDVMMCYDNQMDEVRLYRNNEDSAYLKQALPLGYASSFCLSDDGKYLAICYKDASTAIYDTTHMNLLNTIYAFNGLSISMTYQPSIQSYILSNNSGAVLLHEDMSQYGYISSYSSFDALNARFIKKTGTEITAIPYYTYDMLLEEANQLLEGYEMSERDKAMNHIP